MINQLSIPIKPSYFLLFFRDPSIFHCPHQLNQFRLPISIELLSSAFQRWIICHCHWAKLLSNCINFQCPLSWAASSSMAWVNFYFQVESTLPAHWLESFSYAPSSTIHFEGSMIWVIFNRPFDQTNSDCPWPVTFFNCSFEPYQL